MMQLEGKVALVTGGSSGIGRATALLLAFEGARVVVSDVNVAGGQETLQLIQRQGGGGMFTRADVAKAADVEALLTLTMDTYGRLDGAVNNAGVGGTMTPTDRHTEEEWDLVLNINLKGVFLCMKYELPAMLKTGGGSIVNIASAAGLIGFRHASAYAASKHGVVGLTRSAALEYAKKNIRVNAVCPGFTHTPMVEAMEEANPKMTEATINSVPMRRLGTPEEIAQSVLWLCSDASSFVTGHALAIDGGTVVQ